MAPPKIEALPATVPGLKQTALYSLDLQWLGCKQHNYTEWWQSPFMELLSAHLPLSGCICISLHETPSNLFSCLLFSLAPPLRVSVTNFLIVSIQLESFCKVEAFASETMISDSVKFSKRWSTLLERTVQCLTLKQKTYIEIYKPHLLADMSMS